jgi:hypothetical protein
MPKSQALKRYFDVTVYQWRKEKLGQDEAFQDLIAF